MSGRVVQVDLEGVRLVAVVASKANPPKVVWACPGCGQVCTSPKGLAWHLTAVGPGYASWACKAAEAFNT